MAIAMGLLYCLILFFHLYIIYLIIGILKLLSERGENMDAERIIMEMNLALKMAIPKDFEARIYVPEEVLDVFGENKDLLKLFRVINMHFEAFYKQRMLIESNCYTKVIMPSATTLDRAMKNKRLSIA